MADTQRKPSLTERQRRLDDFLKTALNKLNDKPERAERLADPTDHKPPKSWWQRLTHARR